MKRFLVLISLLSIVFGGSLIFFITEKQPVSTDSTLQDFAINQGDSLTIISSRLQKNGLIRNRYIFMFLVYQLGLNSKLQAGTFRLSPSLSTSDIAVKLSKGGSHDYWLKIIDGQRLEEITPRFDSSLEGYLFPDSYLIPQNYTLEQITSVINRHFQEKLSQAKINAANTKLSDAQAITLASLLEREGRTLETKQKIAGVLLNRLQINMALQIDATVQYARDSQTPRPKTYWLPVSKKDLSLNSPYNTYQNPGLPPAPICNPGYNSLYAAFHPTSSNYLYYLTDESGSIHFAVTFDEHNANVAKYLK